ncbi:guanine nucleotide binding protein, alpha subunit [Lactarius hatsudake]|nr:guanine nucleotide binding protein, alpha subunit [Lactarius hatsudake]
MREAKETEARRVSERIDEQIKIEKQANSRKSFHLPNVVRPKAWEEERMSWRTVIHLNLVRSVNTILDALENAPETAVRVNLLRMRLSPLRRVQRDLETHLGLAEGEERLTAALVRAKQRAKNPGKRSPADEALEVILMSRDDIAALWGDDSVRAALEARNVRLEDRSGFFLDDLYRIAHRGYEPTDDDVVRARLRTMGHEAGHEWIFYDVGGSRSHVTTKKQFASAAHGTHILWIVQAIIFLAPISVFDEKIDGEGGLNRLEDSIKFLDHDICRSYLVREGITSYVTQVELVLFLNKCDILERKLARGVSMKQYISTYGDRANDMPTASKPPEALPRIARKHSPEPRRVYTFCTTAIDTRAMTITLGTIRASIVKENLKRSEKTPISSSLLFFPAHNPWFSAL